MLLLLFSSTIASVRWLRGNAKSFVCGDEVCPEGCTSYGAWLVLMSVAQCALRVLPWLGYSDSSTLSDQDGFSFRRSRELAEDGHLRSIENVLSDVTVPQDGIEEEAMLISCRRKTFNALVLSFC